MRGKKIKGDRQWAAFLLEMDRRHKKEFLAKWKASRAIGTFVAQHGEVPARIPSGYAKEIYFVIHRCADRKNKWQVTEFDERGPYSDVRGSDYMTVAKKGIPTGPGATMKWPMPNWMDWRRAKPLSVTRRNPHMRKNPSLITPLGAFKAAIARRDVGSAAEWYRAILVQDAKKWDIYEEYRRHARQRSYSPEAIADNRSAVRAKMMDHPGRALGPVQDKSDRDEQYDASEILRTGRGPFFRKLRGALRALGNTYLWRFESPKHPRTRERKTKALDHWDTMDRKSAESYKYNDVRLASSSRKVAILQERLEARERDDRKEIPYKTRVDEARAKCDRIVYALNKTFPGLPVDRVRKAAQILTKELKTYPAHASLVRNITAPYISVLRRAGISDKDLAGKFWVALSPWFDDANSPAEFVRSVLRKGEFGYNFSSSPAWQAEKWLSANNLDVEDPHLMEALLTLPGYPSDAQCRQAVNRAERAAVERRAVETRKKASEVDDWLSNHAGVSYYRKPAGWRWLKGGDGKFLCEWVAKSNACIVDRITSGNMDLYVGVLRGPKGEIVGIEQKGFPVYVGTPLEVVCPGTHSCCDKNNQHDAAAWKWASVPQRMKADAAARAERQQRIRMAKEAREALHWAKRRAAEGSSREDIRADVRGDWAHRANPPGKHVLRVLGKLPNGRPFIWTSQK